MSDHHWFDIINQTDLKTGEHHVCVIEDKALAIFNLAQGIFAIEDFCPHQGLPISDGAIIDNEIECPFHGARFCIKTGEVKSPPACVNLTTFETRIHEGMIQVNLCSK
jgi:3-phenylpropionate/trans-cinnamate dioxygenase ferredoxin component